VEETCRKTCSRHRVFVVALHPELTWQPQTPIHSTLRAYSMLQNAVVACWDLLPAEAPADGRGVLQHNTDVLFSVL